MGTGPLSRQRSRGPDWTAGNSPASWPFSNLLLNSVNASWISTDAPRSLRLTYLLETQGRQLALVLCTVDSRPPAQLALSRGGHLLASSTEASVPNTLRLELRDPRPSDEGLYSCSAHSPLGKATTSLELRLEGELGLDQGCRGENCLERLAGPR